MNEFWRPHDAADWANCKRAINTSSSVISSWLACISVSWALYLCPFGSGGGESWNIKWSRIGGIVEIKWVPGNVIMGPFALNLTQPIVIVVVTLELSVGCTSTSTFRPLRHARLGTGRCNFGSVFYNIPPSLCGTMKYLSNEGENQTGAWACNGAIGQLCAMSCGCVLAVSQTQSVPGLIKREPCRYKDIRA